MEILSTPHEVRQWRDRHNGTVGFVPTMGALHEGHAELLRRSVQNNDRTILSIFVNSSQFNEVNDYKEYPRTFDHDKSLAESVGVTAIYAPSHAIMYPDDFSVFVEPGAAALPMEGISRPGHFRGVVTVVIKLLNTVSPSSVYFGTKDFQQLAVIKEVVQALDMSIGIVGIKTVREADGLALSSRNVRLTPRHREKASIIWKSLSAASEAFSRGQRDTASLTNIVATMLTQESECTIDYVNVCDAVTLQTSDAITSDSVICVAVRFGDVRLIDNIELSL